MSGPNVAVTNFNNTCYIVFETSFGFEVTTSIGYGFSTPQLINVSSGYYDYRPSLTVLNTPTQEVLYLSLTVPTAGGMTAAIFSSSDGYNYSNEKFPTAELIVGGTSLATFQVNGTGYPDLAVAYTSAGFVPNGPTGVHYPSVAYSSDEQTFQVSELTQFAITGDPAITSYTITNFAETGGSEPALYIFGTDAHNNRPASAGTYDGFNFTAVTDISGGAPSASSITAAYANDALAVAYTSGTDGKMFIYTIQP